MADVQERQDWDERVCFGKKRKLIMKYAGRRQKEEK